jgi:hypothetical protein
MEICRKSFIFVITVIVFFDDNSHLEILGYHRN